MCRARLLCALLMLLPLCCSSVSGQELAAAVPSTQQVSHALPAVPPALRLASGDLVEITVFDTPELSQKTRIDNNGMIELLVGGTVRVEGLTTSETGQAIEAGLRNAKVLLHPQVSVTVVESAAQTVTVLGEVKNPGSYPLWGRQTATDFIAAAGGLTQYASHTVALTRKGANTPIVLKSAEADTNTQFFLLPGDRIIVGRAGTIYVLGDVGKPGGFTLDDRVPTTVLQGLALAQGMNRTANLHGALIRQTTAGPQQEILDFKRILANQSPDPTLRDGDIVYVPLNAAKDWANRGLNSILQMAVGVVIYGRY